MNLFAKLELVADLAAIARAAAALVSSNLDLLAQVEDVAMDGIALVRNLELDAAIQFVAEAKSLWVAAAARYDGSHAAIDELVAAIKKLIADAQS